MQKKGTARVGFRIFSSHFRRQVMIPLNPIPMGLISLALILFSSNLLVSAQTRSTMKPGDRLIFPDHLTSPDGNFVFGFFESSGSDYMRMYNGNAYLGINATVDPIPNAPKVVWVANRDSPLSSANAILFMDSYGVLKIAPDGEPLNPSQASPNSSATLLNSGNLVISELNPDGTEKKILWQSFDYPTDTLLAGMKVGTNFKTGQKWSLSSWLSQEVPATGGLSLEWNETALNGAGELVIKRFGQVYWASGAINESQIANTYDLSIDSLTSLYNFSVVSNSDESYFTYSVAQNQTSLWVLTYDGFRSYRSNMIVNLGVCDGDSPSPGCVSPEPPSCRSGGQSFELRSGQFNRSPWFNQNISLGISDCWDLCWGNCSCLGYSTIYTTGTGCRIWSMADDNTFTQDISGKQDAIYVLKTVAAKGVAGIYAERNKWWIWIAVSASTTLIALLIIVLCCIRRRKRQRDEQRKEENLFLELATMTDAEDHGHDREKGIGGGDLRIFTFAMIKEATNDFAASNKLGRGGFGPVYKGTLPEGQEIAVKRLSRSSDQGLVEFRNELVLIAKLQHTNLVRLLGCCVNNDEKMLVYEYMPNKSLDFFLFDERRRGDLNWKCRFGIIEGIAQGILYLHRYSRLRIIHRDLKASNILLDTDMQPKISDFGMARIFGRNVSEANTMRVVGTYGYMSPEYAMEGNFSEKSDVYSFGVLLLEIVSGRKNSSFVFDDRTVNLLGYAWELWTQGRSLELKDPILLAEFESIPLIQRCIHVGLLCVQEHAADRPSMSEVVSFLSNKAIVLPTPNQVAFSNASSTIRKLEESSSSERRDHRISTNVPITAVEPR